MTIANSLRQQPDPSGHFGDFGGRYVAETLMPLILELDREFELREVRIRIDDQLEPILGKRIPRAVVGIVDLGKARPDMNLRVTSEGDVRNIVIIG